MKNNQDYVMYMRDKIKSHDLIMVPSATIIPYMDNKCFNLRSDTNTWGTFGGGMNIGEDIIDIAKKRVIWRI
ncbi:hypothetical protein [Candidatus Mycoplasma mahonii]|uniref:hypothetical protein n=1 Tax=Candidatus Mycoplasma mahonii TaxID=3004105 RepID=UPI0026EB047E|nr:hypothetical protein [Candidatus Mycoplasma mahonii]WKX02446.1 hypothetical protein O3I44_03585 [Candidatus Mycoplasma mahonii]